MITYKIYNYPEFEEHHVEYFSSLVDSINKNQFLSVNIDEIIITDDIEGEIQRYSSTRFREPKLTRSREYKAVAKTVDFEDKKKIFFDAQFVNGYNKYTPQIFFEQLIEVYADDLVSHRYKVSHQFYTNTPLLEVVKILFHQWATKVIASTAEKIIPIEKELIHSDVKIFVDSFKRNVRKLHYEYQNDLLMNVFWIDVLMELDQFIRLCLDVKFDNGSFEKLQEFSDIIPPLLNQIEYESLKLIKGENLEFSQIHNSILSILKKCFIEIPSENPMNVQIIDSPKKLFKENVVDTEPRIVAFMDILGFSSIIQEYDSDKTSNILNELHDALNLAVEQAIENTKDSKAQTDLKKFLEYRMFSDCICISLPYIEFGNDFHIQFHSLSTVVKSYQFMMMQKGFFVRGGISIGSYFSDKNMIFSGGLVSAYQLDKGTPVVAIHKSVIERLKHNYQENSIGLFLENSLAYNINEPDKIFLNPFDLLDNLEKHLDYIQNTMDELIKENEQDSSDPLLALTNSMLKMTSTLTKPIYDYAKSQMTTEKLNIGKEEVLKHVNEQLEKYNYLLSNSELTHQEKEDTTKIFKKYDFLKKLCLWSLEKDYGDEFIYYNLSNNN
jgi:hypothetical protein